MRILTIFGTRPEAIKLAPVIQALEARPKILHATCVTGQHREMLDPMLALFGITPDFDLDLMAPGQSLSHITAAVLNGAGAVIDRFRPDWVIVQGDTASAFAGALAAFHRKVPIAHIEAGLRTDDITSPWPEEMNRQLIGRLATLHFAPTLQAEANLLREGIAPRAVLTTGNTGIDALHWVDRRLAAESDLREACARSFAFLDPAKRVILVTGHRRENLDGGLERICQALRTIAMRGDVEIIYPMHLNPKVQQTVQALLADTHAIHLIAPQEYLPFVYLMRRAYLIITDSGGIQEEAPALGTPVLVTRDTTERTEAIDAGCARLVGTRSEALIAAVHLLLDDVAAYQAMAKVGSPFGDGRAAARIADHLIDCGMPARLTTIA